MHERELIISEVRGVAYPNPDGSSRADIISEHLRVGAWLECVRDPQNEHDPNAVKLMIHGKQIGFLDRELAFEAAKKFARWERSPIAVRVSAIESEIDEDPVVRIEVYSMSRDEFMGAGRPVDPASYRLRTESHDSESDHRPISAPVEGGGCGWILFAAFAIVVTILLLGGFR